MLGKSLRKGTTLGAHTVTDVRRNGAFSLVTLSNGATFTVHKYGSVRDAVRTLTMPAGPVPVRRQWAPEIHKVRFSSQEWRGETDGKRGERLIARNGSWDRGTIMTATGK